MGLIHVDQRQVMCLDIKCVIQVLILQKCPLKKTTLKSIEGVQTSTLLPLKRIQQCIFKTRIHFFIVVYDISLTDSRP